jgi:hypothetical protein
MKINADVAIILLMVGVIIALWIIGKVSDARNRVRNMTPPAVPPPPPPEPRSYRILSDREYRDEMFARNQRAREEAEHEQG